MHEGAESSSTKRLSMSRIQVESMHKEHSKGEPNWTGTSIGFDWCSYNVFKFGQPCCTTTHTSVEKATCEILRTKKNSWIYCQSLAGFRQREKNVFENITKRLPVLRSLSLELRLICAQQVAFHWIWRIDPNNEEYDTAPYELLYRLTLASTLRVSKRSPPSVDVSNEISRLQWCNSTCRWSVLEFHAKIRWLGRTNEMFESCDLQVPTHASVDRRRNSWNIWCSGTQKRIPKTSWNSI